jgi:hypothetical protein
VAGGRITGPAANRHAAPSVTFVAGPATVVESAWFVPATMRLLPLAATRQLHVRLHPSNGVRDMREDFGCCVCLPGGVEVLCTAESLPQVLRQLGKYPAAPRQGKASGSKAKPTRPRRSRRKEDSYEDPKVRVLYPEVVRRERELAQAAAEAAQQQAQANAADKGGARTSPARSRRKRGG